MALASATLAAEGAEVGLAQLGLENWTPAAGLAGSWVRGIAETPDGFLWIATSGGLSRFDGRDFANFTAADEPALTGNGIAALARRSAGGLWVGLDLGGVRVLEAGKLRADPALRSLESLRPRRLVEAPAGTLWIATATGLWRWRESRLERIAPAGVDPVVEVLRLTEDPRGGLWVRNRDGIWRIDEAGVRAIADVPGCHGVDLLREASGRLVTACVEGVWETDEAGAWRQIDSDEYPNGLFEQRSGALWIAGYSGLKRRTGVTWERLSVAEGLGDYRVRAFHEDADGNLWIGAYSAGLSRFRRGAVTAVGAPEGLPIDGTTGVLAAEDGSLWIGTAGIGAVRWRAGRGIVERWGSAQGLPTDWVYAVAVDPARPEHVWLGTDVGLFEVDDGRLRRVDRDEGRTAEEVRLLFADPRHPGTLWVGGLRGGLDELRDGRIVRHDARDELGIDRVRDLGRLRSGKLLAVGEEGLYVQDGDRWSRLLPPGTDALSVRAFAEESDGTLWLASPTLGLVRWQGESVRWFGEREGLPSNVIYSLRLDGVGGVWLSNDEGVARLLVADFDRWQRDELDTVPLERLSGRDGLRDRECNGWGYPTSWALPDGRLVYPTSHGLALVDPGRLEEPTLPSERIYLDRGWTGDRLLTGSMPWRLGPRERHLRVRFGAIERLRPESIQFRYRLEELERNWTFSGAAREANYSYLPPGRYRFHLEGRLPGQEWVDAATVATVEVAPELWESKELRFAALAFAALGALALYRWRTRVERTHAAAIQGERTLLRDVIETSPNPIFAKGPDLTYSLANRAAADVYGLVPGDLVGRSDRELASRTVGMEPIDALDREVLQRGEERILPEAKVVDAAGETRWFRVVKRPRLAPSGKVEQVIGTAVDVTDFKVAEEQLRRHEAELEASREELQRLARKLLRAQEEERRRLARELHDDVTQRLAGLAMLVGGLGRAVERDRAQALAASLEKLGEELEVLASDTQALSRDLHPSLLENLGLEDALRSECATFAERTGLRIPFEGHGVPARLAPEASLGLYRIAQEALRNALEHAQSAEVRVRLAAEAGELALEIEDSGVGFAPAAKGAGAGLGLASMSERARLIGARLEVDSAPGRGTRVTVRLPLAIAQRRPNDESDA